MRIVGADGSACLTVATGATYLSRQFHHAFSMVKLDLLDCIRSVSVFRFNAHITKTFTVSSLMTTTSKLSRLRLAALAN